jgi:hypothetical protein
MMPVTVKPVYSLLEAAGSVPAASRAAADALADAEEAALAAALDVAEMAAEASLDLLDKAELAALDAEERDEEALEDFAIVRLSRQRGVMCKVQWTSKREMQE